MIKFWDRDFFRFLLEITNFVVLRIGFKETCVSMPLLFLGPILTKTYSDHP